MVRLDLWTKFAQPILIQFGEGETTVTSKSAATHTLGQEHVGGTHLRQSNHVLVNPHLTRRTRQVQRDMTVDGVEVQTFHEILHDELCWFI